MAHLEELTAVQTRCEHALADFESVLFWRRGCIHFSAGLFLGFQILMTYPNLLPSTIVFIFILNLNRTYKNARAAYRKQTIHTKPTFSQICCSLFQDVKSTTEKALPDSVKARIEDIKATVPSLTTAALSRLSSLGSSFYSEVDDDDDDKKERELSPRRASRFEVEKADRLSEIARKSIAAPSSPSPTKRKQLPIPPELEHESLLSHHEGTLEAQQHLIDLQVHGFFQNHQQSFYIDHGSFLLDDDRAQRFREKIDAQEAEALAAANSPSGAPDGLRKLHDETASVRDEILHGRLGPRKSQIGNYANRVQSEEEAEAASKAFTAADIVNPLAKILGPIQDQLGMYLILPIRGYTNLLSWEDPFVTTWLYLFSSAFAFIALFLPWGFVCYWGLRLFGLAAFGPHMHWVGKRMTEHAVFLKAQEAAFENQSDAERKKIVSEYREQKIKEEAERVLAEAARSSTSKREDCVKKAKYLKAAAYRLLVPSEMNAERIVQGALADPTRSFARSAVQEEELPKFLRFSGRHDVSSASFSIPRTGDSDEEEDDKDEEAPRQPTFRRERSMSIEERLKMTGGGASGAPRKPRVNIRDLL